MRSRQPFKARCTLLGALPLHLECKSHSSHITYRRRTHILGSFNHVPGWGINSLGIFMRCLEYRCAPCSKD
ncbi:BQ2448_1572 [Microbotryum intermedium]|uniref:BQ2448_1572 protein n=1 Tax=Microbotryum intermedium TaxID=269621 RepID=A0A238FGA0_9BASI|nr:BQ2448_1572 [Microbotryum intermedium]